MAATSRKSTGAILRSLSPSGTFCNSQLPPPPFSFSNSSSSASASASSSTFFNRATSPTRFSLCDPSSSAPSALFISVAGTESVHSLRRHSNNHRHRHQKRTCMCSPTTHPGSFRCSLHKSFGSRSKPALPNRLNARRSAVTNSLVKNSGVERELVKQALAALIRPSSYKQRRRGEFRPRQSRLSLMSTAEERGPCRPPLVAAHCGRD